jgi:hypothetical protein
VAPVRVSEKAVVEFVSSAAVRQVEDEIAGETGATVCRDNLSIFANLLCQEIEASGIALNEIRRLTVDDRQELVRLTVRVLRADTGQREDADPREREPEQLAAGFVISYAIYLHYLMNKSRDELERYLKQRRIPKPEECARQLADAYRT